MYAATLTAVIGLVVLRVVKSGGSSSRRTARSRRRLGPATRRRGAGQATHPPRAAREVRGAGTRVTEAEEIPAKPRIPPELLERSQARGAPNRLRCRQRPPPPRPASTSHASPLSCWRGPKRGRRRPVNHWCLTRRRARRPLGSTGLSVTPIGLGLAALGRPAYITPHRGGDLGVDRTEEAMRERTRQMLDLAAAIGWVHRRRPLLWAGRAVPGGMARRPSIERIDDRFQMGIQVCR